MTDLSVDLPTAADLREANLVTPQPPDTPRASAATTPTPMDPHPNTQVPNDERDITSLAPLAAGHEPASQPAAAPSAGNASSPQPAAPSGWGWGGGFSWNGIVDAVKKQSEAVVDVYKRDLAEFVSVVTTETTTNIDRLAVTMREAVVRGDEAEQSISDATAAEETPQLSVNTAVENIPIEERSPVDETDFVGEIERVAEKAETLLNTFSAGLSNFLSSAVSIVPPTLGEHEEPQRPRKILYDRKSAVLEALKSNPKTYTVDPATSDESTADTSLADRFQTFKATYNAPEHTAAITRLLAENGTVEGLFADLVPSQVSADDFWLRYFFRVGELEREEAARKKLMHDASTEEDAFSWGSDDEDDDTPKDVPPKPIPAPRTEDDSENSTLTPDTSSAIAPQQHIEKAGSDGPGDTENPQTEDTAGVRNNSVPKNSPDPSDSFEVVSNKVASTDGERSESDDWDWE